MRSCVIVVENLPVPFDRRVWQEATALRDAGWAVSVICPKGSQNPLAFEVIDAIEIFRHPAPIEGARRFGFIAEYCCALFHEARLLLRIWRRRGFDVVQACNPPDLIFLVVLPFKLLGARFVFDHHDACPELYEAKFGARGLLYSVLELAERLTFRMADLVISANESYRNLAIMRGGKRPEDVVAIYSVPDRRRVQRVPEDADLRRGARIILGYVGVIGDQDGVDHLLRCLHHLTVERGHRGLKAVIIGDGPALHRVRALASELSVAKDVIFTGYLSGDKLLAAMSAFDIGIIPDPVNAYNDKISMNKLFEYSALGIPSVAYPLTETRRLLGDAGTYADDATPAGLARACAQLIANEELRRARGVAAKALADAQFDWGREAKKYIAAYERLSPPIPVDRVAANTPAIGGG